MFHVEHNEGGGNLRVELCTMFHVERSMIDRAPGTLNTPSLPSGELGVILGSFGAMFHVERFSLQNLNFCVKRGMCSTWNTLTLAIVS